MRVISDRVSVMKKDDVFSLVILPTTDKKKLGFLLLWLLAWTACGVIVFINYFTLTTREAKLFVIIYLTFWLYYEFKISRAFIWKSSGKEKLWIKNGILNYQREINGKGKILQFNLDLISDLAVLDLNDRSFADNLSQSFWIKGGERMEFRSQAKAIRFAMQVNDAEAREIFKELNQYIKTHS